MHYTTKEQTYTRSIKTYGNLEDSNNVMPK
jgi:hypothetical protein